MPQMAPLSWLSLYIMFSISLILFCMMNYFIFIPSAPHSYKETKKNNTSMNWKW